jgi:hypothetical protein
MSGELLPAPGQLLVCARSKSAAHSTLRDGDNTSNWPASSAIETSEPQGDADGKFVEREVGVVVLRRPAGVV